MQDDEKTTGPILNVREIGGRRMFKAQALSGGGWLLTERNGNSFRALTDKHFITQYERLPETFPGVPNGNY